MQQQADSHTRATADEIRFIPMGENLAKVSLYAETLPNSCPDVHIEHVGTSVSNVRVSRSAGLVS